MLQLDWDIFPHMRPQVEELFEYLQMRDLTSGLENLFLRVNPGGEWQGAICEVGTDYGY